MEKANVKSPYKNNRYRVVYSYSNCYLIDVDSSWLGYIFFGLNWLVPQKAYILEERDVDDLLAQHIEKRKYKKMSLILSTLAILLFNLILPTTINILYKHSDINYSQLHQFGNSIIEVPSITHSVLLLLSVSTSAVITRIISSKQSKKKILNKLKYNNLPIIKIRITPVSMFAVVKSLSIYILFVLLVISAAFLIVILEGYLIISLCFSLLLWLFLLTNYLSINVGTYKIRKIKEK